MINILHSLDLRFGKNWGTKVLFDAAIGESNEPILAQIFNDNV